MIRPWRETDRDALVALAKRAPDPETRDALLAAVRRPAWLPAFDEHGTLVAEVDGALIGIGRLWENGLHPARWRLSLHGDPPFWAQDVAASLVGELRRMRSDPRPLQAATSARNERACASYQEYGLPLLMRTRLGVLPRGAIPESVALDFETARQRIAQTSVRVVPLPAIYRMKDSYIQLARLHAAIYAQGHAWDPVRDLTDEEAAEIFLESEDLVPEATFIGLEKRRMIAVSSLRRPDISGSVDLGWTGAVIADQQRRRDLVYTLVGACLTYAAVEELPVSFEVDEADQIMRELLARLPVEREPDWLTFAETG